MSYLNFFDDVVYINLDTRPDRREKFEARSRAVGIEARRFPAIYRPWETCPWLPIHNIIATHDPSVYQRKANEISCALSHQAIVRDAKERGLQNIFIFEDDAVFLPNFEAQVQRVVHDIRDHNLPWDIIYFGGEPNHVASRVTDNIATMPSGGVYGCHAYAIHHTFFDVILNWDLTTAWGIIDIFLLHHPEAARQYLLSRHQVVLQDNDSYSDLRGHRLTAVQEQHTAAWHRFVESIYA